MREIENRKEEIKFADLIEGLRPAARIQQDAYQVKSDNLSLSLYQIGGNNRRGLPKMTALVEDGHQGRKIYTMTGVEAAESLEFPEKFVRDAAYEWAGNSGDERLEIIRWGLESPESMYPETDGDCQIIAVHNYYGYSPVSYAEDGSSWDSIADAQDWIDEQESEVYYLDHNEAGRPEYFIVSF